MDNNTNSTDTTNASTPTPPTYKVVLGCLTFFLILPFVLIPFNRFPLGSTGATVISQTEVYIVIGDENNLKTIFLLWGMMVISSYFERERLVDQLLNKLFPNGLTFHWWLIRLSIIDSILAGLFTNDVSCVILTPLILNKWIDQKREKKRIEYIILLALATQANIASKSNAFVHQNSRFQLKTCVKYLWLPVFIIWLLNLTFLLILHRLNKCKLNRTSSEQVPSEVSNVEQSHDQEQPSVSVTTNSMKLPRFTERFRLRRLMDIGERTTVISLRTLPLMIDRSV
ncbi:unnamed protein product [Rotaria sp. Silwood1]|nr:unnamed protein product [Rotaria sp. Silwood1]CAF1623941.1 unnamed protein product [Rotaria sp. Silwood1]CAF3728766.1 unnamed protein product [Rotaria sp. Silwood1]CAF3750027.1 unnamed protein product [Rotaria sp. Silwood1]CAF3760382.1 unnamed protein product [Rotaria sp. Silwood1]